MSSPQISEEELRLRLAARGYRGKELERMITIWESTGMTVDEVLHLKWEDIDFEARRMQVPDLSSEVYAPGDEWLQARAFEPEAEEDEEVDWTALPESALERVLRRERAELMEVFDPNRGLSRQIDIFGQALLVGWLDLAARVRDERLITAELIEYCSDIAEHGYEPSGGDEDRSLVAIGVGATLKGILEDLESVVRHGSTTSPSCSAAS